MSFLYELFPERINRYMVSVEKQLCDFQEIRIRVDKPIVIYRKGREYYISLTGQVCQEIENSFIIKQRDIEEIVRHVCQSSLYAYEEEIRKGYITIKGGHRIGISGQAVLSENREIKAIKNISFLNIRIAHEIKGAADKVLPYIYEGKMIQNTLIVSPPGYGKTTLLRDLIRQISNGNQYCQGRNCSIIDERSELAGCYNGIPQLDVGLRTDVLDGCPKSIGMIMMIRSMGPQVVAVDELGTFADIKALFSVIRSGCSILATIHGDNPDSLKEKSFLKEVMDEKVFQRYVVIQNNHTFNIYDGELSKCLK